MHRDLITKFIVPLDNTERFLYQSFSTNKAIVVFYKLEDTYEMENPLIELKPNDFEKEFTEMRLLIIISYTD